MSAPIVNECRSPAAAAWAAFLQGGLVFAAAALDRVARAAAEHHAVAHGAGQIVAHLAGAQGCDCCQLVLSAGPK